MPRYRVVTQRMLTEVFEIEAQDAQEAADKILQGKPIPKSVNSLTEMGSIVAVLEITP